MLSRGKRMVMSALAAMNKDELENNAKTGHEHNPSFWETSDDELEPYNGKYNYNSFYNKITI